MYVCLYHFSVFSCTFLRENKPRWHPCLKHFSLRLIAWNSEKLREEMLLVQSTSWFLAYHVNPLITIPKMRAFSAPQNVCPSRKSSLWAFLSIDHLYVCQLFKFSKNLLLIFASIKIDNKYQNSYHLFISLCNLFKWLAALCVIFNAAWIEFKPGSCIRDIPQSPKYVCRASEKETVLYVRQRFTTVYNKLMTWICAIVKLGVFLGAKFDCLTRMVTRPLAEASCHCCLGWNKVLPIGWEIHAWECTK